MTRTRHRTADHAAQMPAAADVIVERLPTQLRLLVRVIGDVAAYRLVQEHGGTVLRVPVRVDPDHGLCVLLGGVAYAALVREWGDQRLELPKADALLRQVRHARVHDLARAGRTHNEIARLTQYTRRHVINVLADLRDAALYGPEQGDLFGDPSDC